MSDHHPIETQYAQVNIGSDFFQSEVVGSTIDLKICDETFTKMGEKFQKKKPEKMVRKHHDLQQNKEMVHANLRVPPPPRKGVGYP